MNTILLVLTAFAAPLGLSVVLYALRNAPEGYEDEQGFHSKQSRHRNRHSVGLAILRPHNAS